MFGTDGVRGHPNSGYLTAQAIVRLANAVGRLYLDQDYAALPKRVVVGRDTRKSGAMLESALTAGLTSWGFDVLSLGVMPTPAVSRLISHYNAGLGIVISASHNPHMYNGIKLFNHQGEKFTPEVEKTIEGYYEENVSSSLDPGQVGTVIHPDPSPREVYLDLLKQDFAGLDLTGQKIVLDCAHGACYQLAPQIFSHLGAETHCYFQDPDGENINLDCGAVHPEVVSDKIAELGAHIGFSFDGDGDRVITIDGNGEVRDGDYIMAVLGQYYIDRDQLPDNTVVATSMSNIGLELALGETKGRLIRTDVGDRHVFMAMKEKGYILGGEQSGHLILSKYGPTGDGIVTALEIMRVVQDTGKSWAELCSTMEKYPQLIENVTVPSKPPFEEVEGLNEAVADVEKTLEGNGRLVLRYSGTEPLMRIMVEGKDLEQLQNLAGDIAQVVKKSLG